MDILRKDFTHGLAPSEINDKLASGELKLCRREKLNAEQADLILWRLLHLAIPYNGNPIRTLQILRIGETYMGLPAVDIQVNTTYGKNAPVRTDRTTTPVCKFCAYNGICVCTLDSQIIMHGF